MPKATKKPVTNKLSHETAAIFIQEIWRTLLSFKIKVELEVRFFRKTLNNVISRINESHKQSIIGMNEYKKYMNHINDVITDLDFYPTRITVKFLKSYSNYTVLLSLAKIKIKIIDLTNSTGSLGIGELINLYLGDISNISGTDSNYLAHIEFFKPLFKTFPFGTIDRFISNFSSFKFRSKN